LLLDENGKVITGSETSIKQVAHRIAGCWITWGKKFNYFAADQDAQTFYDEIVYMIARDLHKKNQLKGVVGTLMSNFGLEKAIEKMGVTFIRAKVGDRYVMEQMLAHHCNLGGESSGHIIFLDKVTTGDGIISALQVLSLIFLVIVIISLQKLI